MTDNQSNVADNTQEKEPIIAGVGKVQRHEMIFPKDNGEQQNNTTETDTETQNNEGANANLENNGAVDGKTAPAPALPTPEQLKEYFKTLNIEYDGDEKLKEQLKPKENSTQPTEEQIKQKELAKEKRLLDKFISGGGTAEQYVSLKGVAGAEPNRFALDMAKADLIKGGLTLEEADAYMKETLGQIDDAELEQFDDETDKAFKKRQKEFNAKLLAANSNPHIEKAKWVLQNLNEAIEAEDLQAQSELTLSANIDEQFKKVSLKDTYEIGEINGKAIPPVESEVPQADIAAVHAQLIDPAQRQQLLYNQDGSLNFTKIADLFVEITKLKAAMKTSYHEGSTRTNAAWEKIFPARSANEIGVGGIAQRPKDSKPGQPVSYGKVQKVQPQRQ